MSLKHKGAKMARARKLIEKTLEKNMDVIRNDVLLTILNMPWHKRVDFAFRVIFKKL